MAVAGGIDYIRRFSMCNCATIPWSDTYNAHAMTMDFFLEKAEPGIRVPVPHQDLWGEGYVRVFKIPTAIHTFLFSPFNEGCFRGYILEDGTRYALGPDIDLLALKKYGKEVPRFTPIEFTDKLQKVSDKVTKMWGPNVLKIIILYDLSRAVRMESVETYTRMQSYHDAITAEFKSWPIVQISEPCSTCPHWFHYSDNERIRISNAVANIESTFDTDAAIHKTVL